MKRIVKETLKDGTIKYRVQKNTRLWGLIKTKWHTCLVEYPVGISDMIYCSAVFDTLEEAQRYCGINLNPVVKTEIINII